MFFLAKPLGNQVDGLIANPSVKRALIIDVGAIETWCNPTSSCGILQKDFEQTVSGILLLEARPKWGPGIFMSPEFLRMTRFCRRKNGIRGPFGLARDEWERFAKSELVLCSYLFFCSFHK